MAHLEAQLGAYVASIGANDPTGAFSGYVLVAQHDQPVFSRAYGLADRAANRPPTADTSFRIGSVTKQFTAAAILKLEQEGKLRVEDTVAKHLPDYTGPARDVTIHQLLTHTAGVPSFTDDPAYEQSKNAPATPAQLLARFAQLPLAFPPGSKHAYSNSGYVLLGAIIERVSGTTYASYLRDQLFRPAGMTRTEVGDAVGVTDRAEGYQVAEGAIVAADPIDMSIPFAAGAVRSTANDLVRWHRAISGDAILKAPARAKLYTPALQKYAYGWIVTEVQGRTAVTHGGGIDGFLTEYWRIPDADVVVIAWTNVLGGDTFGVGMAAVTATLGGAVKAIEKLDPGAVDAALIERLVGTYQLTAAGKAALAAANPPAELIAAVQSLSVTAAPTGIVAQPNGQGPFTLTPLADGSFYAAGPRIHIRYILPPSGRIVEIALVQGPVTLTYGR